MKNVHPSAQGLSSCSAPELVSRHAWSVLPSAQNNGLQRHTSRSTTIDNRSNAEYGLICDETLKTPLRWFLSFFEGLRQPPAAGPSTNHNSKQHLGLSKTRRCHPILSLDFGSCSNEAMPLRPYIDRCQLLRVVHVVSASLRLRGIHRLGTSQVHCTVNSMQVSVG